jgi:hypothetical protein
MCSLPTWAVYSIVLPLVLLSPMIAFFLELATDFLLSCVLDAGDSGAPASWRYDRRADPAPYAAREVDGTRLGVQFEHLLGPAPQPPAV